MRSFSGCQPSDPEQCEEPGQWHLIPQAFLESDFPHFMGEETDICPIWNVYEAFIHFYIKKQN